MFTMNIGPMSPGGRLFAVRTAPPTIPTTTRSTLYATNQRNASRGLEGERAQWRDEGPGRDDARRDEASKNDHQREWQHEHENELHEAEDVITPREGETDDARERQDRVRQRDRAAEWLAEHDVEEPPEHREDADEQGKCDEQRSAQPFFI